MPCIPVGNGKYKLGQKGGTYKSKSDCERAYAAYRAKKYHSATDGEFLDRRKRRFGIK